MVGADEIAQRGTISKFIGKVGASRRSGDHGVVCGLRQRRAAPGRAAGHRLAGRTFVPQRR